MRLSDLSSSAPGRALRNPNFRLYTFGNLVSLLGTRIHEIAAGWLVWTLTESATWLGAMAIAELIPRLLVWPIAGVLADRFDRRKLAMIFQSLAGLSAAGLALANALDVMQVWMVVFVHGLLGLCNGFWQPARMALLNQVVPRQDMPPAVALSSVIAQTSRVVGPAIAGVVIVYAGITTAFVCNALSFLAVIVAFQFIAVREGAAQPTVRKSVLNETMEGMRYVIGHPGIGPLILIIIVYAITVRPIFDLFPGFADAVFHSGAGGLSMLNSALGAGALVGGIWVSWRSGLKGLTTVLAVTGAAGALATMAFALTDIFPLALGLVAMAGCGITLCNIISQTLIHAAVDDAKRGRVFALYGMINGASPGIGTFAMGVAADQVGLPMPVAIGGAIGMGLWLLFLVNRRRLASTLEGEPSIDSSRNA